MFDKMIFSGPMFEMLVAGITFLYMLTSGSKFGKRIVWKVLLLVIIFLSVTVLEWYLVDFTTASTAWEVFFCIGSVFLYSMFGMKNSIKKSCYFTTWSYLFTSVVVQITMPIAVVLQGRDDHFHYFTRTLPIFLFILVATGLLVKKKIAPELQTGGKYRVSRQKMLMTLMVWCLFIVLSNYQLIFWLLGSEPETMSRMITIYRLILGFSAIGVLLLQNSFEKKQCMEQELEMIQQFWYRQQDQYRLSQENIDLINQKCHDLKHQMAAIRHMKDDEEINRQLKEMEHSVMIYDSVVKTGNPVLDTVLTEKSLYCEEHQIIMTCMADGSYLDFIDKVDLYTMFGNAIDNAVESVMKLTDKEKRVIQVSVFNEKNLLMIRVKNHCEGKLKFVDGLPVTTKKDKGYHGFGLKSMQHTAEKYGGTVVCQQIDTAFVLQILLPIP